MRGLHAERTMQNRRRTAWNAIANTFGVLVNMVAGLLVMAASAFGAWTIPTLLTAAVAIAVVPVLYSYVLYRRLEGGDCQGGPV